MEEGEEEGAPGGAEGADTAGVVLSAAEGAEGLRFCRQVDGASSLPSPSRRLPPPTLILLATLSAPSDTSFRKERSKLSAGVLAAPPPSVSTVGPSPLRSRFRLLLMLACRLDVQIRGMSPQLWPRRVCPCPCLSLSWGPWAVPGPHGRSCRVRSAPQSQQRQPQKAGVAEELWRRYDSHFQHADATSSALEGAVGMSKPAAPATAHCTAAATS